MKKYFISPDDKFYKVNLHSHSTVSDGKLSPLEMKEMYKKAGYSAVAFTDHNLFITHNELTDSEFVALNGYESCFTEEYTDGIDGFRDSKSSHLCIIALSPDEERQPLYCPKYISRASGNIPDWAHLAKYFDNVEFEKEHTPECVNKAIKICRERGFFVTYNHPHWSLDDYTDYSCYEGFHALEIYNNVGSANGYDDYCPSVYDDLLRQGKRISCVATDDNHNTNRTPTPDSFGGFTMVKADRLEYTALTSALVNGDTYASCGPLFEEISFEDGKLYVKSATPVRAIDFSTNRRHAKRVSNYTAEPVFEGEFELDVRDTFVRVTLVDFEGHHANTRAYFKDEL